MGYADQLGSGVRKLFRYTRLYSGDNPTFSESDIFRITVPLNELYSYDTLDFGEPINDGENKNEPINEPINDGETKNEPTNEPIKLILDIISKEPHLSKECIADKIGKSRATVTRTLTKMQNDGLIRRVGSNKGGHWEIIK
ncbi:MAG: winged helix-turn-helix transcriptional regulator [Spirochaetales bacterium]|nr:winged helix-turn-helix transcriptional regulator [Spirochaetales bacterium]